MLLCFVLLSFRISFTNFYSFIPPFLPFLLPALSTLLICSSRRLLNFLFIVLIIIKRPSQQNFVLSSFNWFELLPVSSCPLLPSLRVTFSCVVVVSNFLIFGSILHNLFKLEKCNPQRWCIILYNCNFPTVCDSNNSPTIAVFWPINTWDLLSNFFSFMFFSSSYPIIHRTRWTRIPWIRMRSL